MLLILNQHLHWVYKGLRDLEYKLVKSITQKAMKKLICNQDKWRRRELKKILDKKWRNKNKKLKKTTHIETLYIDKIKKNQKYMTNFFDLLKLNKITIAEHIKTLQDIILNEKYNAITKLVKQKF